MIILLPSIRLEGWVYIWCGMITVIKVMNICAGFHRTGSFPAIHSRLNRLTGLLLFPVTVNLVDISISSVLCFIVTVAAAQKWYTVTTETIQ